MKTHNMDEDVWNPIYKFTTSVCDGGFGGWGKGEAGETAGDLSATGNRFHFLINCCISLWTQFVCVSRKRERASLRKIFFIVDYILPGCKGARNGRRSSWWCKKCVLIRVIREPSCVCHLGRCRHHSCSLCSLCTSRL